MATIHIDENLPKRSYDGHSTGVGGVVRIRSHSLDRRSVRTRSIERRGVKLEENEDYGEEGAGLRRVGDFKQKQVFKGKMLAYLAYQSIGVIYGDIGTSPLYVYSSTFLSEPSHEDLLGVLSTTWWW